MSKNAGNYKLTKDKKVGKFKLLKSISYNFCGNKSLRLTVMMLDW